MPGLTVLAAEARPALVARALRLEVVTVGWNVVEAAVALFAAREAGSVALLGFGVDSVVECSSGLVLLWRLRAERSAPDTCAVDRVERRAQRLVALSLFALAVYVAVEALRALAAREAPEPSPVGIVLTTVSLLVMMWLSRRKGRVAVALGSRALAADAFQTTACWWLSAITLIGLGANAAAGWWWADPAAALLMPVFLMREGRDAWQGRPCGCG